MKDLKPICKEYFWAWGDKNISKLAEMFAEDVRLRDWNLTAFGREQTLIANSNIFTSVKTCSALPLYMYQDGNTVACRLNVYINDDNAFEVLDLITFNDEDKIVEILAFRGN